MAKAKYSNKQKAAYWVGYGSVVGKKGKESSHFSKQSESVKQSGRNGVIAARKKFK